jgi:hypothetical protein
VKHQKCFTGELASIYRTIQFLTQKNVSRETFFSRFFASFWQKFAIFLHFLKIFLYFELDI